MSENCVVSEVVVEGWREKTKRVSRKLSLFFIIGLWVVIFAGVTGLYLAADWKSTDIGQGIIKMAQEDGIEVIIYPVPGDGSLRYTYNSGMKIAGIGLRDPKAKIEMNLDSRIEPFLKAMFEHDLYKNGAALKMKPDELKASVEDSYAKFTSGLPFYAKPWYHLISFPR